MNVLVRPVSLFDIPLLRRLQVQAVPLDPQRALTRPESPLGVVLRAPLALHQPAAYTYLARLSDAPNAPAGFVQLRSRQPGQPEADITHIAPALGGDAHIGQLWARLLEVACWEAAAFGMQRIFASLPADSDESIPFLNAGFVIFAREELLRGAGSGRPAAAPAAEMRPQRIADTWALQRLYASTVPLGVKQAEGLNSPEGSQGDVSFWEEREKREAYVWERQGEIVGHVGVTRGRCGHWLHITLHPDRAELAAALVDASLALFDQATSEPIYTHVRTYESQLKPALLSRGFEPLGRRDLTVRQTLARVKEPALVAVRALEHHQGIPAAPTVVHIGPHIVTHERAERLRSRRSTPR